MYLEGGVIGSVEAGRVKGLRGVVEGGGHFCQPRLFPVTTVREYQGNRDTHREPWIWVVIDGRIWRISLFQNIYSILLSLQLVLEMMTIINRRAA